jgi:hypothetical protein
MMTITLPPPQNSVHPKMVDFGSGSRPAAGFHIGLG